MKTESNRADAGHGGSPPAPTGFQYSSGAFQPSRSTGAAPQARHVNPPKQPRGRFFVVGMVMTIFGWGGFSVFETFFHYSAYGVVEGRNIEVPATTSGVVHYVHVEEGQYVQQGQLLMTLHSPELDQKLGLIDDQIVTAQARLQAGVSQLKWEQSQRDEEAEESLADFYDKWAQYRFEQVQLQRLQRELQRAEALAAKSLQPAQELEKLRFDELAQREKLEKSLSALTAWEKRAAALRDGAASERDALLPLMAEIEGLESELRRARSDRDRLEIRSPVNGLIAKRHRFTGEGVEYLRTVFTVIEEGSLHVKLYIPQEKLDRFETGREMSVHLAPFWASLPCKVTKLGHEHVFPPPQIARFYPHQSKHIPVHLQPNDECLKNGRIQLGAVVKLPLGLPSWNAAQNNPFEFVSDRKQVASNDFQDEFR